MDVLKTSRPFWPAALKQFMILSIQFGYSEYVTEIYNAITEVMPSGSRSLLTFAAGEPSRNETNESAYLRNEKALFFYNVLVSNAELFQIDTSNIVLHHSLLFRDEVAIKHSCYSKNLRRWMKGQLPRKRRCRAEFAVLAYCWASAFGTEKQFSDNHLLCKKKIREICYYVLNETYSEDCSLLELIWHASCNAYIPHDL